MQTFPNPEKLTIDDLVTGKTIILCASRNLTVKENTEGEVEGRRGYDFLIGDNYFYVPSEIFERYGGIPLYKNEDPREIKVLRELDKRLHEHNGIKYDLAVDNKVLTDHRYKESSPESRSKLDLRFLRRTLREIYHIRELFPKSF